MNSNDNGNKWLEMARELSSLTGESVCIDMDHWMHAHCAEPEVVYAISFIGSGDDPVTRHNMKDQAAIEEFVRIKKLLFKSFKEVPHEPTD